MNFLSALEHIPQRALPQVFKHASRDQIKAVVEIARNRHSLPVTPHQVKRLRKHRKYYNRLASCCTKEETVNYKKAKHILEESQTGGALPLLFAFLLPLIGKAALAGAVSAGTGLAVRAIADR